VNECREPSTRIRGARPTISCNSSSVAGRWIRSARYLWVPAQLTSVTDVEDYVR
jgi:hypothetical protein